MAEEFLTFYISHNIALSGFYSSSAGITKEEGNDGSTLFQGMEPYMEHHFLNTDRLNWIAWRVKDKRPNVYLNPNQMRLKIIDGIPEPENFKKRIETKVIR